MTPVDVSAQLAELSREIERETRHLAVLDEEAVRSHHRHKVEWAQEYLTAKRSGDAVETAKAVADLACADIRLAADLAAAAHRGCQESLRSIRTRIETGRTLASTLRAEWVAG